jgi:hypothetical protein
VRGCKRYSQKQKKEACEKPDEPDKPDEQQEKLDTQQEKPDTFASPTKKRKVVRRVSSLGG